MEVKLFKTARPPIINQCYLVEQEGAGVLIDPAWDYGLIDSYIIGRQVELKAVLLTHSHPDHTDLAETFAASYEVPVFISREEFVYYRYECPNLVHFRHLKAILLPPFEIIPILTPGHTAGSACFLIGDNLFTGDTIFIEGVGVCHVEGSDVNQMYESVQFLKHFLSEEVRFWPGHSFGAAPGKNLRFILENNIYFQLNDRKMFTAFRMRKGQPPAFGFK